MSAIAEGATGARSVRRAIVSGANGYLGSFLVRMLVDRGVEVHALVNRSSQHLDGILPLEHIHPLADDISRVVTLVQRVEPDAIFHLAAVYSEPKGAECIEAMFRGNLLLGTLLAFAAAQCPISPAFLNAGTYWQFAESGRYIPNTLYATTKQGFQDVLAYYQRRHQVSATTLILYDVFGPSDYRPKLWNKLIHSRPGAHIGLSLGTQEIELVHVADVANAFILAANLLLQGEPLGPLYSVRGQNSVSLRKLVEDFNEASGLHLDLGWGELPTWEGVIQCPWRGELLPGWQPSYAPIQALVDLVPKPAL